MKLAERLNVLIQAITLSQKSGVLTFEEAVKAKSAIDVISSGILNQNFSTAVNILIELAILSQKRGVYSFKDSHMIYLAVEGIENEFQNAVNDLNRNSNETQTQQVLNKTQNENQKDNNVESIISIPPKKLKRNT